MTAFDDNRSLEVTLSTSPLMSPREGGGRCYLLCVADHAATTFDLPEFGDVTIGRAPEVELHLKDKLISRQHARLFVTSTRVRIADLDSRHGTMVNGERLKGTRALQSGDVISIGSAILVFHRRPRPSATRAFLDDQVFFQRLDEELERALHYRRSVSLAVIELIGDADSAGAPALAGIVAALAGRIRGIDAVSFTSTTRLIMLLPELDDSDASAIGADIVTGLAEVAPSARAGVASCPSDGADADTLRSCARTAARAAAPGTCMLARDLHTHRKFGDHEVLLADPAMQRVYGLIDKLARTDLPILVTGDTGAGKELAAAAVHYSSERADGPFVSLNCGALSQSLLESELFGHVKGAFTGAVAAKPGVFERADGGTLFLDELGEMSASAQVALLRALETRRIMRVGDTQERTVDVRLVAATNRDLHKEIESGRFRRDLFFRLSTARLALPPLCDRSREIPIIARVLLARACARHGRPALDIGVAAGHALMSHTWPGNVRELSNAMQYAAATADDLDTEIDVWHLPADVTAPPTAEKTGTPAEKTTSEPYEERPGSEPAIAFRPIAEEVRELEKKRMLQALAATDGRRNKAAALIAMPLRTFVTKLKRYGIQDK